MGFIAGMTPGTNTNTQIPRLSISADDLVVVGKIEVKYYKNPANIVVDSLKYNEIKDLKIEDSTWKLDLLLKVTWSLKSPMPVGSGHMQKLQ